MEQSPAMYGGTCINIACVPTKTLLTDAHRFAHSGDEADQASADEAFASARVRRDGITAKMNSANHDLATGKGVLVIDGAARFTGERTVEVTGGPEAMTLNAKTVIINTGAVPVIPPVEGADGDSVLDSTAAQKLDERPESMIVVGGGPIGLEFATMFAQFGAEVTVLDRAEEFFGVADRDVAAMVKEDLEAQGITIVSGIEVDDRGAISVDEHLRTSAEGVYAVGDVNGGPQFTYISFDDHRVVLSDRWGDGSRTTEGRIFPVTTFLTPPLAQIGLGEDEARKDVEAKGHTLEVKAKKIAEIPIMPRPKIVGEPQGMAKFLVDADEDRIVGATLYCVDSQELINTVALAMANDVPASAVGSGIYTHPSSSEVFNALLG